MASRTQPFLMTGAAVASAAAIVAATPALVPTHDLAIAAPSPLRTSTAQVALTAITDITLQGINDAYWFGWGGYITDTNTYYPGVSDIYLAGGSGVLYYLVDNAAETFLPGFDLDNYYFEIGAPSVPYVAAGELFGTDSPIFQAAQTVFYYGVPNVVNSIVVSATTLFPTVDLGPVKVGGGILASLYFYGQTPDYDPDTDTGFAYSTNGLSAILAYISTSISDSLPSAAALSGAATAAAAAVEGVVKNVENAFNPAASSSAAAKTSSKTAAAEVKTESTESSSSGQGTTSTEESSTEESSTEDTSTSTGIASSAKPATKATKPAKAAQNTLNKIGKQISDALGITKKSKPSTKSSSDSSSSGDSDGSSSTGGSAK
ncbi:hypothetical protein MycrhDRAFT_0632 [Mycolicibacterium rhodesiae JS60]|nr:hypothetical protein MycrhDRAFT_0632 [Mycolicibacterium rhodesiae JS60]